MARAQSNPTLIRELGLPVESGWLITGSIEVSGSSGSADLSIPIKGPLNTATVYVTAAKRAGKWKLEMAVADVEGRENRINLVRLTR